MAPKLTDYEPDLDDAEFLDDIGVDREGEHKTVGDDDADGGASAEAAVFDFDALDDLELEARLSQLCRWLLDAEARGGRYALRLPTLRIDADRGPAHLARCLRALALHDPPDELAATGSAASDASPSPDTLRG